MKQVFWFLILLAPALWSCEKPQDPKFKTVENLKITEFNDQEVVLEGDAVIHNPNAFSIEVIATEMDVKVNDVEVGKVRQNERTEVAGNSDFRVPLIVSFPPEKVINDKGLLGGVLNAIFKKKVNVHYKGTITVSAVGLPIDVPVEAEKEMKLKKSK